MAVGVIRVTQEYKTGFLDGWRAGIDEARHVIQQVMGGEKEPEPGKLKQTGGRLVWVAPGDGKGVRAGGLGMA